MKFDNGEVCLLCKLKIHCLAWKVYVCLQLSPHCAPLYIRHSVESKSTQNLTKTLLRFVPFLNEYKYVF